MKRLKELPLVPVFLLALTVWIGGRSIAAITANAPSSELPAQRPVIVIDAGHGGFDGGAEANGIVEKDINLAIALKTHALFTALGFDVVLTRDADMSLEDEGISGIRKRKNSDIHNRLAQADSFDNAILLSIHQNKFPQSSSFGAQIFYGTKNTESQRIAGILQEQMIRMLQPDNTRQAKPCTDDVYLIDHATMPALLIECGFLSNIKDAQLLVDPDYQQRVAFAIVSAVCESLGMQAPAQDVVQTT